MRWTSSIYSLSRNLTDIVLNRVTNIARKSFYIEILMDLNAHSRRVEKVLGDNGGKNKMKWEIM